MSPDGLDGALVAQAKAGSRVAFERLVARHQQAVRAFLRRLCGDWAQADDLAQETFLAAWSALPALRAEQSLRAWLCGIGYRKHLDQLRAGGRRLRREADWLAEQDGHEAARDSDRLALERAMAALKPEQRACVALCLAGDFSHSEAAASLQLPLGTVKSHVTRGRARLAEILGVSHG